jgi:hypothetical protein
MSRFAITLPDSTCHRHGWTHDRLALAVALWLAGCSARQIAGVLDTSKGAVVRQLVRLGFIGRHAWRACRRRPGLWAVYSGARNRARARRAGR